MTLILDDVPDTLERAINAIHTELSDSERDFLLEMPRKRTCEGLGQLNRGDWNLWDRQSPLVVHCLNEYALVHSQDLSCLLMDALWSKVHGVAPRTKSLAAALRAIWRAHGYDPASMQPIPEVKQG